MTLRKLWHDLGWVALGLGAFVIGTYNGVTVERSRWDARADAWEFSRQVMAALIGQYERVDAWIRDGLEVSGDPTAPYIYAGIPCRIDSTEVAP